MQKLNDRQLDITKIPGIFMTPSFFVCWLVGFVDVHLFSFLMIEDKTL